MRHPGGDFWHAVDRKLKAICDTAREEGAKDAVRDPQKDAERLCRCVAIGCRFFTHLKDPCRGFNHYLKKDKDRHGNDKDCIINNNPINNWQQEVEDIIEASPGSAVESQAGDEGTALEGDIPEVIAPPLSE
jgi:hypothetical protein